MDDEALHRAAALRAEADALANRYRRATWVRFTLVFFPVPFVVVLLRLQVESWIYALYGGAYVGLSALLYVWDGKARDRCAVAEELAKAAERDGESHRVRLP